MGSIGTKKDPPLTVSVDAVMPFVEKGLDLNLRGVKRGLEGLLKAERGLGPSERVEIDNLTLFGFVLLAAPSLLESWVSALQESVAALGATAGTSAVLVDPEHNNVRIVIRHGCVTRVLPAQPRRQ